MSQLPDLEFYELSPEHLDEVNTFLTHNFYPRENICRGAGYSDVDPRQGLAGQVVQQALSSGLSLGAREQGPGARLVAVSLNYALTAPPPPADLSGDPLHKLYLVLGRMWKLLDVFKDPGVTKVVELEIVCCHPDHCRKGVARRLTQMAMDRAFAQGCQIARIDISSPYSEKFCFRLGFQTRATLDLHTLPPGLLDLSQIEYKQVKLMTRNLTAPETPT